MRNFFFAICVHYLPLMIYFSLSPIDIANYRHIGGIFHSTGINNLESTTLTKECITPSVYHYLDEIHGLMENHSEKDRHTYQKYTNPSEFIGNSIPNKQFPVANYLPLTSTYFHMIELMHEFQLIDKAIEDEPGIIQTIHLSNDPGCIEAAINVRRGLDLVAQQQELSRPVKKKNPIVFPITRSSDHRPFFGKRFGFGALSDSDSDDDIPIIPIIEETDEDIPTEEYISVEQDASNIMQDILIFTNPFPYNEFLQRNPQIRIDTNSLENLVEKYGMGSMDFITGMTQKDTQNEDEGTMLPVLWSQILNALCLQKPGKSFVMRINDCFHVGTLDLLYILTMFYREVHVVKLMSSSAATSEKYIVCHGFTSSFTPEIRDHLVKVDGVIKGFNDDKSIKGGSLIRRFLDFELPSYFIKKMEDCNVVFGKQQIETIQHTLALIDKRPRADKLELIVRKNLTQCIEWCQTYHIPVNHIGGMGINRYK